MTSVTRHVPTWHGSVLGALAVAVGLLGWPGAPATGAAQRPRSSYGHTSAPDRTLRSGCHDYGYRYRVKAPTDDWTLETFLRDPDRRGLASGAFTADSDPRKGRGVFRFCRYSTHPGRFTIRAKLTWYDEMDDDHVVWLEPSHFRLRPR